MKTNLKVAQFLTLVARGGPVAHEDRLHKTVLSDLAHICGYVDAKFQSSSINSFGCIDRRPRSTRSGCKNRIIIIIKRIVPNLQKQ